MHATLKLLSIECGRDEFECNDGACIGQERICDGYSDCENGEDEDSRICSQTGEYTTDVNGGEDPSTNDPYTDEPIDLDFTTEYCKFMRLNWK